MLDILDRLSSIYVQHLSFARFTLSYVSFLYAFSKEKSAGQSLFFTAFSEKTLKDKDSLILIFYENRSDSF